MTSILTKDQQKEVDEALEEKFGKEEADKLKEPEVTYERFVDIEETEEEEEIGISKEGLEFDKITQLLETTDHLEGFDLMDEDLGLGGNSYKALKKGLYYYQNSLRQDVVEYKINHKTKIDNRPHLLIITSPGTGKTTIKNQNKRVLKEFGNEEGVIEVSGVSHPEQLVGKIVYKGKGDNKKPEVKLGILGYSCVMNDESQDMLNEKNDIYAKSQRLKRLAMDTYGDNIISKKLVADSPEDVLEYPSPSRICDFAHPVKLESPFFDTGSFRRYFAFNIEHDQELMLDDITDFKFDDGSIKSKNWLEYLDENYEKQTDVIFDENVLKIVSHYHKCILYYLLKHKNSNAMRYGLLTRYSMRGTFCKNILILAKAKKESTPSLHTILSACNDTLLFILKSIETYNNLGNIGSSSDVWGGICEQDIQALEYLYRKKAFSKETSNISVRKFQSILANFYGCKRTQSRAHHYRLKRNGFVDSHQAGKYDSRVWLKFIPKEINLNSNGFDPLKFWDSYFKGASAKNTYLTALRELFTDDKEYQKSQGDGGVGVMGCAISKFYICVEVYGDKNKNNNIYTGCPPPTDTLDTLAKKPKSLCKKAIKGVKTPKKPVAPLKSKKKAKKTNSDREVQFRDPHCKDTKDIAIECSKDEVYEYIKNNPKESYESIHPKFGMGFYKWIKELKDEGEIK